MPYLINLKQKDLDFDRGWIYYENIPNLNEIQKDDFQIS